MCASQYTLRAWDSYQEEPVPLNGSVWLGKKHAPNDPRCSKKQVEIAEHDGVVTIKLLGLNPMYVRRRNDVKISYREFLARGQPVPLLPGDGFTLVLDNHLWVLCYAGSRPTTFFASLGPLNSPSETLPSSSSDAENGAPPAKRSKLVEHSSSTTITLPPKSTTTTNGSNGSNGSHNSPAPALSEEEQRKKQEDEDAALAKKLEQEWNATADAEEQKSATAPKSGSKASRLTELEFIISEAEAEDDIFAYDHRPDRDPSSTKLAENIKRTSAAINARTSSSGETRSSGSAYLSRTSVTGSTSAPQHYASAEPPIYGTQKSGPSLAPRPSSSTSSHSTSHTPAVSSSSSSRGNGSSTGAINAPRSGFLTAVQYAQKPLNPPKQAPLSLPVVKTSGSSQDRPLPGSVKASGGSSRPSSAASNASSASGSKTSSSANPMVIDDDDDEHSDLMTSGTQNIRVIPHISDVTTDLDEDIDQDNILSSVSKTSPIKKFWSRK